MINDNGPEPPLLHAKFLFDEVDTGWALLRSARALSDTDVQGRTLAFAQGTHDAVQRLAQHGDLTHNERRRLETALASLQAAINAFPCREQTRSTESGGHHADETS